MIIFFYLLTTVVLIIILTSRLKFSPAISLLIASFFLGLILELNLIKIFILVYDGIWNSVKGIGLIILFSCIIGQFLKESNSIKNFGNLLIKNLKSNSILSLNFLGLFVGTVVFCDSAFLILNGISRSIASTSSISLNSLNLSLAGGLYSSHTLIPPTPGPIAAISNFNLLDNIGMVMILGVIVAIPSSIISYLFAKKIMVKSRLINIKTSQKINKPHILAYMSIIIPLVLISLNTLTNLINKNEFLLLQNIFRFIGNPISALLLGSIFSYLIPRENRNNIEIIKNSFKDFIPIILITSSGAGFANIIKNSEIVNLLPGLINIESSDTIYICIIGFICSSIIKTTQGSSTSSIIIVSAILFPIIQDFKLESIELSMIILSIGAGSMMISHVNDSYFWIVLKKTKLNLLDGIKYYTLMTTFQSLGTLLFIIMLISIFL
tara:strand:+ start:4253 stop:5563 length:1311 start_codon:yes stop_codon:yes gene_type:complete